MGERRSLILGVSALGRVLVVSYAEVTVQTIRIIARLAAERPTVRPVCLRRLAWVGVLSTATAAVFAQQTGPRTPYGHPDFQGTYELATLTPLQRPQEFEAKPFLTDAEAAEYISRRIESRNADRRSSDPLTDLLGSYNEFWFERPNAMLKVRGRHLTSRIVDPPDGRVPALTPAAQQRLAAEA